LRFSTAPTGIRRGSAENGFRVNGEPRTVAQLRSEIERLDGYTVDGFVRQHLSVGRFNPAIPNTVRLVTTCDPDSKEPFIAGAVLCIGTSRSWPVDSFIRGDLCAPIDLGTGAWAVAPGSRALRRIEWMEEGPS
jgi:hypothetical protein